MKLAIRNRKDKGQHALFTKIGRIVFLQFFISLKKEPIYFHLQLFADSGDKTETATVKKRQDLRKKGQVNQSKEIPAILMLLSIFASMRVFGDFLYREMVSTFHFFYQESLSSMNFEENAEIIRLFSYAALQIVKMSGPFLLIAMFMGGIGSVIQVGFMFTLDPLIPKFSKINPFAGLKRMFSARSLFETVKATFKIAIVIMVAWMSISAELGNMAGLISLDLMSIIAYMLNTTLNVALKVTFALLVIAIIDFIFQYRQHEKEIKMSKQEVKEEYKQMEGSPEIRSRIRQKQRDISMRRMMQEVPKADVVITNPTHFAVAIKYDPAIGDAPIVIAKGADYLAARIREIATENRIQLVENKPLAQALYAQVDIGKPVPQDLYKAVAEVLAFVYGLQGRKAVQS